MSFNTTVTPRGKPSRPADIILASDIANGLAYAAWHDHAADTVIVTPRSIARLFLTALALAIAAVIVAAAILASIP